MPTFSKRNVNFAHVMDEKMFLRRVADEIAARHLFAKADKLLLAVSGGADSVALLRALKALGYACEAAHCNFHLRGEESDRDEAFVRQFCAENEVLIHVQQFDTQLHAHEQGISIEMAARELRYAFFERLRTELNAAAIVVAHHRDDSVETLLINLTRGTGIHGLAGIRPRNGHVVRPLLGVCRADIESYLHALGQPFVTDSTNLVDDVVRNQIRLNVLPLLQRINPSVNQSIANTAARLSDAAALYDEAVSEAKRQVISGNTISLEKLAQTAAPATILFEILHPMGFTSAQVEQILATQDGEAGHLFESEKWRLLRDRGQLIWRAKADIQTVEAQVLPLEGIVEVNNTIKLIISRIIVDKNFDIPKQKNKACFDLAKLEFPLLLRQMQTGDRFVPFGMTGEKLLSDYLTDRKFSLFDKEQQLVVCSGKKVAWLVGERTDNRFCVDTTTRAVLEIEVVPF